MALMTTVLTLPNVENNVSAAEFNQLADDANTIVVDMRNHYESRSWSFVNAITPDVETFEEKIAPRGKFAKKGRKIKSADVLHWGGIRCESQCLL